MNGIQCSSKFIQQFRRGDASVWWSTLGVLCCVSAATRLHRVAEPDHVAWDETHFGKMVGWYINRTFFFDVHPPAGKLLLAGVGYLTGYDGSHPFEEPGQKFNGTSYVGMRAGCALLGAALVPMAYVTVWEMTHSLPAAALAAAHLLLDGGMVTLSQYILLDPVLLFFIMATAMGQAKLDSLHNRAFLRDWWLWLSWTGAALAGAVSVKFVGLFTVAAVGLCAVRDVWAAFSDISRPLSDACRHLVARALGLLVLPSVLYVAVYAVHFGALTKTGPGDGMLSSVFQTRLQGNFLYNASMPEHLYYGGGVTLRSQRPGAGLLHSHEQLYPAEVGPAQQQVTAYLAKDFNNVWLLKKWNEDIPEDVMDPQFAVEEVRSGDLIRLEHEPTGRNLHSHRHPAPLTRRHYQVSGYGNDGQGDSNDVWRIELEGGRPGDPIPAVSGVFRLIHYMTGCALFCDGTALPEWGSRQHEVSCAVNTHSPHTRWNVEENFFERQQNVSSARLRPGLWHMLLESHHVQLTGNAGFRPKPGEVTSRPWQWPLDYQGQWFSAGAAERRHLPPAEKAAETRVYLLGNPAVWWGALAQLVGFCVWAAAVGAAGWRWAPAPGRDATLQAGARLLAAWTLHYAPFFCMCRVLYYHHYFPAQLFAVMLAGVTAGHAVDAAAIWVGRHLRPGLETTVWAALYVGYIAALLASFVLFSPLTYGMSGPDQREAGHRYSHLLWLSSWEF